jgi:MFS family permease
VAFLPQTLLIAIGSQVTSRLIARFGTRNLMVAGSAIAAAGLVWLSTITPHSTFVADLLGPFLLIGTGMGLSVTPVVVAGTSGVEPREAGLASGLLNTSRIVGAAVGLAALSTVAATRTASVLASGASGPGRVAAAVTDGYSAGLVVGAVILVVAAGVALFTVPALRQARPLQAVPAPEPQSEQPLAVALIRPGGEGPERESA